MMNPIKRIKDYMARRNEAHFNAFIDKAMKASGGKLASPVTLMEDPYDYYDPHTDAGHGNRSGGGQNLVTYSLLREMADTMIVSTVIDQLVRAAAKCARYNPSGTGMGWRIVRVDSRETMKAGDAAKAEEIAAFVRNCTTGERKPQDDSFVTFVKKFFRDSIVLDQACFEIVHNRMGQPAKFIAVDAATIRRVIPSVAAKTGVHFVQVINGAVKTEYRDGQLAFCVRNPTTDINSRGYGMPELQGIMQAITAWLFGFQYNMQFFRQGAAVRGVFALMGNITDKQFKAFQRRLHSYMSGIQNAHTIPLVNIPSDAQDKGDLKFITTHLANKDMEYSEWMNTVVKIICGKFGVDPSSTGFVFGATGQKSQVFGVDEQSKEMLTRARGVIPLLDNADAFINDYLVSRIDPEFRFEWTGIGELSDAEKVKLTEEETKTYKTINEARAERDLKPIPGGDIVRDSVYLQSKQSEEMQGQQGSEHGGGVDDEDEYSGDEYDEYDETPGEEPGEEEGPDDEAEQVIPTVEVRDATSAEKALRKAAGGRLRVYEIELLDGDGE